MVHGFGEYAVLYHHMIAMASLEAPQLTFAVILPTSHHLALITRCVPQTRILCLEQVLRRVPLPVSDLSMLANYAGNIHTDIEAEKKTFKFRPAGFQLARAVEIYQRYRAFVLAFQPHHVLLSHVESYEQKMLESLCRELRIPVSVPTDLRTIGGSFMAPDTQETLPTPREVTDEVRAKARDLMTRFRAAHLSALTFPIPEAERGAPLDVHRLPLPVRAGLFVRRVARYPDQFEWDYLRAAVLNNMPGARDAWWRWKTQRAAKLHDISTLEKLPTKFVYYPLHLTPESSINTPAPYYVDQLRVVDAIRMAMPSDHHLVVKEHYASVMVRPLSQMRALRKRSGVTVMHFKTPGRELIKRAALTISVTGTSTLEAFVLGRPALMLGGMFLARYIGGVTPLSDLPARIRQAIGHAPTDATVEQALAEIMSIAKPFTIFHVNQPGNPAQSEGNIRNLLLATIEQIDQRSRSWAAKAET
jgi:hypothetical protein